MKICLMSASTFRVLIQAHDDDQIQSAVINSAHSSFSNHIDICWHFTDAVSQSLDIKHFTFTDETKNLMAVFNHYINVSMFTFAFHWVIKSSCWTMMCITWWNFLFQTSVSIHLLKQHILFHSCVDLNVLKWCLATSSLLQSLQTADYESVDSSHCQLLHWSSSCRDCS